MVGDLLLPFIALLQFGALWPLMVPRVVCMATLALVIPNSSACALAGQEHQAGVASALMGTMQFAIAGVVSALVGALHDGTALPMTTSIALCGVGAAGMAVMARRVGGEDTGLR